MTFPRHLNFTNGKTLTHATLRDPEFWAQAITLQGGCFLTPEEISALQRRPKPLYIPVMSQN